MRVFPKGVLLPPAGAARPRRGQLYRALRTAVLEGVLRPGDRLPSTREAAADYGVSRGTIEEVYAQLTEEGFLERAVGRGSFVAATVSRLNASGNRHHTRIDQAHASGRGRFISGNAACREPSILRPFNAGVADTSEFPWKIWQRLGGRAARELGRDGLSFADPRGLPELRAAIARHLAQFRGIRCDARQVAIFNSAQQALNALALLLLDPGDAVWMEDPGYPGARAAFALGAASIVPVPVDDDGIRVALGVRRSPRARAAYVTPAHQYPTGAGMTLDRRIALLQWAARNRSWIIEDDYDGEFRYEGQPLTALYCLDTHATVLHVGTLNKSMFVALRLAYAVVPDELAEPLANIRTQLDGFTPPLVQKTMSLFMEEGYFSAHLRRMRAVYREKRALLAAGLERLAPLGWTWSANPAGMHVLLRHPNGTYVRAVAAASSLDLALLSSYRVTRGSGDGLLLRFGALDPATLREGVAALVAACESTYRRTAAGRR